MTRPQSVLAVLAAAGCGFAVLARGGGADDQPSAAQRPPPPVRPGAGRTEIFTAGRAARLIRHPHWFVHTWTPDGRGLMAFENPAHGRRIAVLSPANGRVRRVIGALGPGIEANAAAWGK